MKKQELLLDICRGLRITPDSTYTSTGSTVTRKSLREIYHKINPNDKRIYLKQDLIRQICNFLSIPINPSWLSEGSTVTKDSLKAIHEELVKRGMI